MAGIGFIYGCVILTSRPFVKYRVFVRVEPNVNWMFVFSSVLVGMSDHAFKFVLAGWTDATVVEDQLVKLALAGCTAVTDNAPQFVRLMLAG